MMIDLGLEFEVLKNRIKHKLDIHNEDEVIYVDEDGNEFVQ